MIMNTFYREILDRAHRFYKTVHQYETDDDIKVSSIWLSNIQENLNKAMALSNVQEIIHFIQECDGFTYPRRNNEVEFYHIVNTYNHWLETHGISIDKIDPLIQESHFTSPKLTYIQNGRCISTMYFWHLAICFRIQEMLKKLNVSRGGRVLEIGGGFGGLARLYKLYDPSVQYIIFDIPESLFFSYIYAASNFSDLNILLMTQEDSYDPNQHYDFVFIPNSLIRKLQGMTVDVVINTQSLGEMKDVAVDRYMRLIQEEMHTRFFYSNNQYGQKKKTPRHRSGRNGNPDCASAAVKLDPYWKVHLWNLYEDDNFNSIEFHAPPALELFVERVQRSWLNDDYRQFVSNVLLQEAIQMPFHNNEWEFKLWESIRLFPNQNNLSLYLQFLKEKGYKEFHYYNQLLQQLMQPTT